MTIPASFRALARSPWFTLTAILTIALGIAANAAIFSIADRALLRPLPYRDPDRLVWIASSHATRGQYSKSSGWDFNSWKEQAALFESVEAFWDRGYTITGTAYPEALVGWQFTPTLFATLGAQPSLGRTFTREDGLPGRDNVVVLSDALWRRRFDGASDVIGRSVQLDGRDYTIVGVMPPGFAHPYPIAQLWTPLTDAPALLADRKQRALRVVARLRAGRHARTGWRGADCDRGANGPRVPGHARRLECERAASAGLLRRGHRPASLGPSGRRADPAAHRRGKRREPRARPRERPAARDGNPARPGSRQDEAPADAPRRGAHARNRRCWPRPRNRVMGRTTAAHSSRRSAQHAGDRRRFKPGRRSRRACHRGGCGVDRASFRRCAPHPFQGPPPCARRHAGRRRTRCRGRSAHTSGPKWHRHRSGRTVGRAPDRRGALDPELHEPAGALVRLHHQWRSHGAAPVSERSVRRRTNRELLETDGGGSRRAAGRRVGGRDQHAAADRLQRSSTVPTAGPAT